jgi:small subunit ribosomal protein S1
MSSGSENTVNPQLSSVDDQSSPDTTNSPAGDPSSDSTVVHLNTHSEGESGGTAAAAAPAREAENASIAEPTKTVPHPATTTEPDSADEDADYSAMDKLNDSADEEEKKEAAVPVAEIAATVEAVEDMVNEGAPETPAQAEEIAAAAEKVEEAAADEKSEEGEISAETMGELIKQYPTPQGKKAENEVLSGTVVALNDLGVVVDIGAKREGLIPASEFGEISTTAPPLSPGQVIEVERLGEEKDGYALLSYQRPLRRSTWKKIEASFRAKETIEGTVADLIKGGLVVDIGVRAFLPASQVDIRPQSNLEHWKGQKIAVRVLKLNRKRGNVVVSRRALLEEEQEAQRKKVMEGITEGQVLTGKVKNITDYGVFVDLGGVDGLLHITDLSWGRLKHPSEAVAAGQEIEVQVLHFDKEKGRVSLGRKQLIPDPWAVVPEKFVTGARVKGKVVGVTDYGAFIELDPGVEGLVHISEMTWSKKLKHPSKVVKEGDEVEVAVLDVKPDERRISLGMKQTLPDPWQELANKYPVGTVVTGRVRNLTDFGAFVEIEEGFDGLVHVSDITWAGRVKNPGDALKKGETITAKVLKIDVPTRRVSLGIKQVNDIWANWFAAHKMNDLVKGKVSRMVAFGAFVELADGIEGLCHISEIEDRKRKHEDAAGKPGQKPGKPGSQLEPGKEYDFKIVKLDPDQHRIGLSYRNAQKQAERQELQEYRTTKSLKSSPTATIGDMMISKGKAL